MWFPKSSDITIQTNYENQNPGFRVYGCAQETKRGRLRNRLESLHAWKSGFCLRCRQNLDRAGIRSITGANVMSATVSPTRSSATRQFEDVNQSLAGNPEALMNANRALVGFVIKPFIGRCPLEYDELKQVGLIALWQCAHKWKPGRAKFSTFAVLAIRWAVWRALATERRQRSSGLFSEPRGIRIPEEQIADRSTGLNGTYHRLLHNRDLAILRSMVERSVQIERTSVPRSLFDAEAKQRQKASGGDRRCTRKTVVEVVPQPKDTGKQARDKAAAAGTGSDSTLPEELRLVVMKLWRKFYTVHEIANSLGISPEAVQQLKNEYRRTAN